MIRQAVALLTPHGQFFSFQDPLRYDSISKSTYWFSSLGYLWWRIFKGDVVGGLRRRFRRGRGIYLDEEPSDNAEYHVTRNGVDQDAIRGFFDGQGFDCEVIPYFSTHSRLFQPIGSAMGVKNTFAVIARKASC